MKILFAYIFTTLVFVASAFGQDSTRNPKIESIGIFYSVIPLSRTYHLQNANIIGIQANFRSKNKLKLSAFAFYATNTLTYRYNIEKPYNPQTIVYPSGHQTLISFTGNQYGAGASLHYEWIKRKNFILSPGMNTSLSFFSKASAEYGTANLVFDSLFAHVHYSVEPRQKTENYDNLKDILPDIFLINLNAKCQFLLSKQLTLYTESLLSLIGIYKNSAVLHPNLGITVGMSYRL